MNVMFYRACVKYFIWYDGILRILPQKNFFSWFSPQVIDLFLKDFQYGVVRVLGDFDISDGMITTFKELRQLYGD